MATSGLPYLFQMFAGYMKILDLAIHRLLGSEERGCMFRSASFDLLQRVKALKKKKKSGKKEIKLRLSVFG